MCVGRPLSASGKAAGKYTTFWIINRWIERLKARLGPAGLYWKLLSVMIRWIEKAIGYFHPHHIIMQISFPKIAEASLKLTLSAIASRNNNNELKCKVAIIQDQFLGNQFGIMYLSRMNRAIFFRTLFNSTESCNVCQRSRNDERRTIIKGNVFQSKVSSWWNDF